MLATSASYKFHSRWFEDANDPCMWKRIVVTVTPASHNLRMSVGLRMRTTLGMR